MKPAAANRLKTDKKWKYLTYTLCCIVILAMIFAFLWGFAQIHEIKTRLLVMQQAQSEASTSKAKKSGQVPRKIFTALSLTGNGQVVQGWKGIPIRNWQLHFQYGDIDFVEEKKIRIRQTGLYQLYAQMFFYNNAETYGARNISVMDFGVRKVHTNERIISATVALSSCEVACTRHISSFVFLQSGDLLIVDTATSGVYFKMIAEKTLFGAYLVSDV